MKMKNISAKSTAEEVTEGIDGSALTAVITGTTSGIGTETARVLALRGVHVVMAVRNVAAADSVKQSIVSEIPTARIDIMEVDLSSFDSVRAFASNFKASGLPLNILINNAGLIVPFKLSPDNIELVFATNHLGIHMGHFLLTNLLLERMKKTAKESGIEGRIVIVSSEGHRFAYCGGIRFDKINSRRGYTMPILSYGQSKLANILHANELAKCLKEEGANITVNSLHPGYIDTKIIRVADNACFDICTRITGFLFKSTEQGAATTCYVALHPQMKGITGEYLADCKISKPSSRARDFNLAKKLWDFSTELVTEANIPNQEEVLETV